MTAGRSLLFTLLIAVSSARADFQGATHMMPFDEDSIGYSKTASTGAVARLQKAIADGKASLKYDSKFGYLPSVLESLGIPVDSQILVFSKTSFQREHINPENPRALFFNDNVYVGFIPGSPMLEVSEADPKLGAVFYTLDQTKAERPKFSRNDQCLECHASAKSMGVPGHLLRSLEVDDSGVVDLSTSIAVNHRTPFNERWGGWYVTGQHGAQSHRGNLFGAKAFSKAKKDPNFRSNISDLSAFIEATKYPRNQSDIAALMVIEHQSHMHNFIARLQYETAIALQQYGKIDHLKSKVDSFLQYALFTEEASLTNGIKGSAAFRETFEKQGPFDSQGRSLRQLDLSGRLFKYPCSYLIYSEAFDALQPQIKEMIYKRLLEILSGADQSEKFQALSASDRKAILAILRETKRDLADSWRAIEKAG
jgi:hypothetical protein